MSAVQQPGLDQTALLRVADELRVRALVQLWIDRWRRLWRERIDMRDSVLRVFAAEEGRLRHALAVVAAKAAERGLEYTALYALEDLDQALATPVSPRRPRMAANQPQRLLGLADCPGGCDDGWFYFQHDDVSCATPCGHCLPELERHVDEYLKKERRR